MTYSEQILQGMKYKRVDPSLKAWSIPRGVLKIGTKVVFLENLNMPPKLRGNFIIIYVDERLGGVVLGDITTGERVLAPRFAIQMSPDAMADYEVMSGGGKLSSEPSFLSTP